MKILHAFDFFSPYGGGTVDVLYKLSRALAQKGHEVTIYTSDFKLDKPYVDSLAGVNVKLFHCLSSFGSFYYAPDMAKAVKNNLKNFDVVHLHSFRSYQNIVIRRYAKKYGVPYIMDDHGSLPRAAAGDTKPKWLFRWFFDVIFGNRILRDATRIVTENNFGARELEEFGADKSRIAIIPLLFPVEDFTDLPPRGQFRQRYQINDKKVIMFLGRINRIKGIEFLVDSFAELARSSDNIMLVIVGPDDGYQTELKNHISSLKLDDRVLFTGFLGGKDKLAALVDADVVVQPSRYEQAAWAPIEAVLCGTPIIVSGGSGSGEDVTRMDAGYLVNYGDKAQMVQTIQMILSDPSKAQEKVARAREYIRNNLSINKKVEEYEKLYGECIRDAAK